MHGGEQDNQNKNMKDIIPKKILLKKALPTALIVAVLGFGLFLYDDNKDFISSFKPYYIKSYIVLISHKAKNLNNHQNILASGMGIFATDRGATISLVEQQDTNLTEPAPPLLYVPILLYHGIVEHIDRFSITPEGFGEQMNALKSAGYEAISIEQFHDFMKNKGPLPPQPVLIVFDDGRKDSYYGAQPILKGLEYKATMFVAVKKSLPSGTKPSTYYLSENELKKMIRSGVWSIQSHAMQKTGGVVPIDEKGTQGNFLSNKMWLSDKSRIENDEEYAERVLWELSSSKKILEETFKGPVLSFAYPFGDYGQQQVNNPSAQAVIEKSLEEAGYDSAFRQIWDSDNNYTQNSPLDSSYLLKRIEPSPSWSGTELTERLAAGKGKLLPYSTVVFKPFDWRSSWGDVKSSTSKLYVSANKTSTGALAILDGSLSWTDYIFKIETDWNKGDNISLFGRVRNVENYVACSFTDRGLRIEQYLKGKKRIMVEKNTFFEMPKKSIQLGIVVNKDKVECLVNGNSVIYTYYLSPALSHGGIGIKTWDPVVNNSEIMVTKVDVVAITGDGNSALAQLPQTELVIKEDQKKERSVAVGKNTEVPKDIALKSTLATPTKFAAPLMYRTDTFDVSMPYTISDLVKSPENWISTSGDYFIKDNFLHVTSSASSTAGHLMLDGTSEWKDYSFKTTVNLTKGKTFSVVARYGDDKNNIACSFSDKIIEAEQSTDGKSKTLSELKGNFVFTGKNREVGIGVYGDTINCYLDGKIAIKGYNLDQGLNHGGIGFKTWDPQVNNSELIVKSIAIKEIK